jgi:hypothetical protein
MARAQQRAHGGYHAADMSLHIIKLCVGAISIEDLADWQAHQKVLRTRAGLDPRPVCDTRMTPKRRAEVLAGGSLYWVIKGVVLVRQCIEDIVTVEDEGGRSRCELILSPDLVRTAPLRRKAFQGWRYLLAKDAPCDITTPQGGEALPLGLRDQLLELGVW